MTCWWCEASAEYQVVPERVAGEFLSCRRHLCDAVDAAIKEDPEGIAEVINLT